MWFSGTLYKEVTSETVTELEDRTDRDDGTDATTVVIRPSDPFSPTVVWVYVRQPTRLPDPSVLLGTFGREGPVSRQTRQRVSVRPEDSERRPRRGPRETGSPPSHRDVTPSPTLSRTQTSVP